MGECILRSSGQDKNQQWVIDGSVIKTEDVVSAVGNIAVRAFCLLGVATFDLVPFCGYPDSSENDCPCRQEFSSNEKNAAIKHVVETAKYARRHSRRTR